MRSLYTLMMVIFCVIAGLQISVVPALCQMYASIADILSLPGKYYDQEVILKGKVTKVTGQENSMGGTYILTDGFDDNIEINCDILPLVGKSYEVTVIVYRGIEPKIPLVREVGRIDKSRGKIRWILVGLVIVCLVALVLGGTRDATEGRK